MNNANDNCVVKLYNDVSLDSTNLVKLSSQIKANTAAKFLKQRLKNYIIETD